MADNLGYVVPSWLDNSGNEQSFDSFVNQNNSLKIGQVTKINYPDDENKAKSITYDVMITERTAETINHMPLTGCVIADMFGGLSDYLEYTMRANSKDMTTKDIKQKELLGSYVLVLYQNGSNNTPVIIGGSPNADFANGKTKKRRTEKDGHFLNFVFNGVNVNINKNGELLIRKDGPTKSDGSLNDKAEEGGTKDQAGSLIQIDKDGNINITANKNKVNIISEDINCGTSDLKEADRVAIAAQVKSEIQKVIDAHNSLADDYALHMHPTAAPGPPAPPVKPFIPRASSPAAMASKTTKANS